MVTSGVLAGMATVGCGDATGLSFEQASMMMSDTRASRHISFDISVRFLTEVEPFLG